MDLELEQGLKAVADLIRRDRLGENSLARTEIYERIYRSFFESTMSLYEKQYLGFGDARLMTVKTTWDYAYYWSVLSWLYFRDVLTDLDFLRDIQPKLERTRVQLRFPLLDEEFPGDHGPSFDLGHHGREEAPSGLALERDPATPIVELQEHRSFRKQEVA